MNIEQRTSFHKAESKIKESEKIISDPLEGIVEGKNRQERYVSFITNVLGKIWPNDENSGRYGDDFYRSSRWEDGDVSGYTQSAPTGRDPCTINAEDFENMVANIGPDYLRARIVPHQLLKPSSIIPTGGSCAIETWGMRNIANIREGIKLGILPNELLADAARKMIDTAPTITHVSGAMLSGQNVSVLYEETDLWKESATNYGLPEQEADLRIKEAYDRIYQAVERRAKLINPNAIVIPVNFDELPLKKAITEWFSKIGIPYNPEYRIAEVAYTYDGPRQKELVIEAIKAKIQNGSLSPEEEKAALKLIEAEYHVRLKQIDHLRWESMDLPDEVIIDKRGLTAEEKIKYQQNYVYHMMIEMLRDVFANHTKGDYEVISLGFADLPYGTEVQHESRNVGLIFSGTVTNSNDSKSISYFVESLEKSLDPSNPARLHRLNVERHLAFLKDFMDLSQEKRDQLTARRVDLGQELNQIKKEIKALNQERQKYKNRSSRLDDKRPEKQNYVMQVQELEQKIQKLNDNVPQDLVQEIAEINSKLGLNFFPLRDNPFVHHSMQFLFDKDFVSFLVKAVQIQKSRTENAMSRQEANEKLRELMAIIYPKLEAYINYIYGRIDYPVEIRNRRLLQ